MHAAGCNLSKFVVVVSLCNMKQAELITSVDSDALLIALEPEAASFYCRTLSVHEFAMSTSKPGFPSGTKYVIVDAGGESFAMLM